MHTQTMLRLSIVFALCLSQVCVGQQTIECKGLGQYCTSHDACCSNSCLSFSYKCVEYHGSESNTTVKSSVENSIAALVERINNDNNTKDTSSTEENVVPITSAPIEANQMESLPNEMDRDKSHCRVNGLSCLRSNQCCSSFCSKITNICIEPTENSLSTEQITRPASDVIAASALPSCTGIGKKCYSNEECCPPLRCHGYLHQCVT